MKNIFYILLFLFSIQLFGQVTNQNNQGYTVIKGAVQTQKTFEPLRNVKVEVLGGGYTETDMLGEFSIKAKVGDEVIISHPEIETVRYIIKNKNDKLKIYVEELRVKSSLSSKRKVKSHNNQFTNFIDSANSSYKKDAAKSIQYVTKSLQTSKRLSVKQEALAYKTLGDIYLYWKQYDLAIPNYIFSLKKQKDNKVQLTLGKSYFKNVNYNSAINAYKEIDESQLSNWEKVILNEELGDTYAAKNDFSSAQAYYQKGLTIAKEHLITPKITDLNSKLGEVAFSEGKVQVASTYFDNSLNLAADENVQRATIEKERVADFYNSNQQFDQEIALRKKNLKELETLDEEVITENSLLEKDSITTQKTNYKIANAYVQQSKYDEAIPYLKKSISEANKKSDLVIEKDATRKLSEVYKSVGDYTKALESYQSYVELVDIVYLKKEQEIAHASKVGRDLVKQQQRILSLENERELSDNKLLLASKDSEIKGEQNKRQSIIIYSLLSGLLLLVLLAFYMYRNIRQQKTNNNLLALKSLRSQMNPHFIFNALNSVNSFIASNDERTANRYLTDFSKLMRSVLENSEEDFIPLSKEIELLELYTKLEHFRFQDKFEYAINIDPTIRIEEFLIPPMLLQPYIENAVWHGLRYKEVKGLLQINLKRVNEDELEIIIEDDGIGRSKSKNLKTDHQKKQASKGMGNIKKRVAILNEMYKDKVDVFIDDIENDGGTRVTLTIKKD